MTISIHALLAESDPSITRYFFDAMHFYPRSPCGERPNLQRSQHHRNQISIHALLAESDSVSEWTATWNLSFLSTLSLRRATRWNSTERPLESHFYPRSPCGERRELNSSWISSIRNFYPRSPCGERHPTQKTKAKTNEFLSTLSLRRATSPKP